jgi:hypothetical protein
VFVVFYVQQLKQIKVKSFFCSENLGGQIKSPVGQIHGTSWGTLNYIMNISASLTEWHMLAYIFRDMETNNLRMIKGNTV